MSDLGNRIGIIGYGFVGQAIAHSFKECFIYDKFKSEFDDPTAVLSADIVFVCVPTLNNPEDNMKYDLAPLHDVSGLLQKGGFKGTVVIKSTILPGTTLELAQKYGLDFLHNPEFLSAKTACQDFLEQKHIVIGHTGNLDSANGLKSFYQSRFPEAKISLCSSVESETMKLCCNTFYASKVQLFTEFKLMCDANGANFNHVRDMMLQNGWINPMHTQVPGSDGQLSYGGACFPKDSIALNAYLDQLNSPHDVISAMINERAVMRGARQTAVGSP